MDCASTETLGGEVSISVRGGTDGIQLLTMKRIGSERGITEPSVTYIVFPSPDWV